MKNRYGDYLKDILEAITKIEQFLEDYQFESFAADEKTQYAVIRAIEIIGEATKKLSKEIKNKHPEVPWREMSGMRDKLIHDYFGVDLDVVWKTAKINIPPLKSVIRSIAENEGKNNQVL